MSEDKNKASGILIGYKGVKYGLQKRKNIPTPSVSNAFGEDSSDDEAVDVQVAKQQQKNATAAKIQAERAAAEAEDNTVYEYDSVYDHIQRDRESIKRKDVEERKPKYIQALIQKAEIRKKEQEIAYERRLLKERKQDDHLYEDKEAFLTSAYKKKLIEDKYWKEREKRLDAVDEAEDVTKKKDLTGFYQNLCTKNVAFASNRLTTTKASEADEQQELREPHTAPEQETTPQSPAVEENRQETVDFERMTESKTAMVERPSTEDQQTTGKSATTPMETVPSRQETTAVEQRRKRRNDEASIASAKERYLARKRASRGE